MTNEELLKYIHNTFDGRYKTIEDLKRDSTQAGQDARKLVRKVLKKDRRKQLESGNKLTFGQRFSKIDVFHNKENNYLHDNITGAIYSHNRMVKKAVKKTLLSKTGRQLKKEKRYLREQAKLNGEPKEV